MSESDKIEQSTVLALFDNIEYIVPVYQRNYAWGNDQIKTLIDDVIDFCDQDVYFLGTLILNKIEETKYEVIDGQQRLTTLFLILSYLNFEFEKERKTRLINLSDKSLRFESRENSNKILSGLNSFNESDNEIIKGYQCIKNYFKELAGGGNLISLIESFWKKLECTKLVKIQVPEKIELNHYFEIMNTRGEQLEAHEIAKSLFLGKLDQTNGEVDFAALIWEACSDMDSYIQMNFEKEFRDIIFSQKWNNFTFSSFDEIFEKVKKFFAKTNQNVFSYNLDTIISMPYENTNDVLKFMRDKVSDRFESVLSFPQFLLQVNAIISENNIDESDNSLDDKRLLDILQNHMETTEKVKIFFFHLLKQRFLFDKYILKREYKGVHQEDGMWSLQKLRKSEKESTPIYSATFSNDDQDYSDSFSEDNYTKQVRTLQSCFRITYTSPKTMHWITEVMKTINKPTFSNSIMVVTLENYACKKLKESNFETSTGFGIQRIVFTYLDYILYRDGYSDGNIKIENSDFVFQFRNSIEHFYPQTPAGNHDKYEIKIDDIGNLALITVSTNSKFSNLSPKSKMNTYGNYSEQSLKLQIMKKIVESIKTDEEWIEEKAENHGKKMKALLREELKRKGFE